MPSSELLRALSGLHMLLSKSSKSHVLVSNVAEHPEGYCADSLRNTLQAQCNYVLYMCTAQMITSACCTCHSTCSFDLKPQNSVQLQMQFQIPASDKRFASNTCKIWQKECGALKFASNSLSVGVLVGFQELDPVTR